MELTLRPGEEPAVTGDILFLSFLQVYSDDRCPQDVVCVHPGNAEIGVGIRIGKGPTHLLRLNTDQGPRSVQWFSLRVTLSSLLPLPVSNEARDTLGYQAILRIEPQKDPRS